MRSVSISKKVGFFSLLDKVVTLNPHKKNFYFKIKNGITSSDQKLLKKLAPRPVYRYASIYRSILFWASVHVILWVCFTAVISERTLVF